ncbi:MAG TPA: hypothetical protein VF988_02545, partial [Verrucomicrobiae bacterium]
MNKMIHCFAGLGSCVLLLMLGAVPSARGQGTGFTYQGRLNSGASAVTGLFDLRFAVYDAATNGALQTSLLTNSATPVTNGLFTVTLDFGAGVFTGGNRWLDIGVRTNGATSFTVLWPRQAFTAAPYAQFAGSATAAAFAAGVPAAGIGAGTANINISGNAATATSAAAAASAINANFATTAATATSATSAATATMALTAGTATNLAGVLPDAQLSTNIARLNGTNNFTGTNIFSSVVMATNPANQIFGTFTGSGAGLTGLSSISLAPGSITAAMLAPGAVSSLGAPDGSPTNALTVDTNGYVGIGSSTPMAGLQISSAVTQTVLFVQSEVQNGQSGWSNLLSAEASAVNGNLLAVGGWDGVTVADITDPTAPLPVAQLFPSSGIFTNLYNVEGVAWAGSNLVAAGYYSDAVTIIGCTNPSSPVKLAELLNGVGGWNNLSIPSSVAVASNLLAIGSWNGAVTLADISNPSAPVFKIALVNGTFGFTNISAVSSVALSGSLLAIGSYNGSAVTLVNVANPTNPQKLAELCNGVGGFTNLIEVQSVALSGNLLAIAAYGSSTVTLVDISNPANPLKLAELRNGVNGYSLAGASSVAISGNRLLIGSDNANTVTLVDISNPARPLLLATAQDGLNGADYLNGTFGVSFAGANLVACGVNDNGLTILGVGTQAVGLNSSGWVGIGTTRPAAALDVAGNVLVENATMFDVSAL